MEASLVTNHSMVPQLLEDDLVGQDLVSSSANSQPEDEEEEGSQEEDETDYRPFSRAKKVYDPSEVWEMFYHHNKVEDDVREDIAEDETDYSPFIKAIQEDDVRTMELFIDHHPEALSATVFPEDYTALHYALSKEKKEMAMRLVERMTADDLEILKCGFTALALAADMKFPGVSDLIELMVKKNPKLPNITGEYLGSPVKIACSMGHKNSARFLYSVTDKSILSPERGEEAIYLLSRFIDMEMYDIAIDLVRLFPDILLQQDRHGITPIESLAKMFHMFTTEGEDHHPRYNEIYENSNERKQIHNHYHDLFDSVCTAVSTFDGDKLRKSVYPAIMDAAKHGNAKFITEMITANPRSLRAHDDEGKSMLWHAIENRQEKVFSLIYKHDGYNRDLFLEKRDYETGNNILHLAAMLPPPVALDRISSSPLLQLQREVLWFKEVWSLAGPSQKEARNKDGLTPRQLFSRTHADMIATGEKLIKETATSSTVVGALILTIMFAAAFTVPGGNNQETGYPIFANKILFKLFIMCDVLSLSSSATSILVFLTMLANSHAGEDFLFDLPRRLMLGVLTLFFSIATMMMTFCFALALMLNGRLQLILPIAFIASIPVFLFSKSMFPLVSTIFHSTFGSSIFDRETKRLTPWDQIALVIGSIRKKAALKEMRAKPEEMDAMV